MADEIVASEGRGKWMRVGDDLNDASYIVDPAGAEYEISASRMAQIDRDLAVLLNDMLDSLFDLQNENEALRARDALRDRAEGQRPPLTWSPSSKPRRPSVPPTRPGSRR